MAGCAPSSTGWRRRHLPGATFRKAARDRARHDLPRSRLPPHRGASPEPPIRRSTSRSGQARTSCSSRPRTTLALWHLRRGGLRWGIRRADPEPDGESRPRARPASSTGRGCVAPSARRGPVDRRRDRRGGAGRPGGARPGQAQARPRGSVERRAMGADLRAWCSRRVDARSVGLARPRAAGLQPRVPHLRPGSHDILCNWGARGSTGPSLGRSTSRRRWE